MIQLPAPLQAIAEAVRPTEFHGDLWLVGGAVRDQLLGLPTSQDYDLVTQGDALDLAHHLHAMQLCDRPPVIYPRFGTALVDIQGSAIELVRARRESYAEDSRKPFTEPGTLKDDALRRDFTVNTLLVNLATGELRDILGSGLPDLERRILRTPLDPLETFHDDPLRMLRAVRFRWKLGFLPASGLYEAVREKAPRLSIVSQERIRDELNKIMLLPEVDECWGDLMDLGLVPHFAPQLVPMVGCEQGSFHHLDVWEHSLLVLRNVSADDLLLRWAALLHDVGKPSTRFVDVTGATRFFGHETVGADLAQEILDGLRFSSRDTQCVARLVRCHMRLGSSPEFTASAARRLIRDMNEDVDRLLALVEADAQSLRPGVRKLDLSQIRGQIERVRKQAPKKLLDSPLSGREIGELLNLPPGPEVGEWKRKLVEKVLEGDIGPGDKDSARKWILSIMQGPPP